MPRAYSQDLRWRIIRMKLDLGAEDEDIEEIFDISKPTIDRYLRQYRRSGTVDCMRIGRPIDSTMIAPDEQRIIIETLLRQPDRRLREIQHEVAQETGNVYSLSAIHYYLRRNGVTRKKLKKQALQRNEERRAEFRATICTLNPNTLVFLDESGFDKRIARNYGYSFRGTRATIRRRHLNWGPRITAIPIVNCEGFLDIGFYRGNIDGNRFLEFVNHKLVPLLLPFDGVNPRSVVVMDNASIHQTPEVLNAIRATGALVLFLPPYSPDYMPCEGIFSLAKCWIRENDVVWHATDEAEEFVFHAFMEITNDDVVSFCRHAEYI